MRITRATIALIERLKAQGRTHLAIAAEVGCSERTVRSVLAGEHALQPRQLRARGQRLARGEAASHPFPCPGCRAPITALPCPACHVTLEQRMNLLRGAP